MTVSGYLDHLTDDDLALLADFHHSGPGAAAELRSRPATVARLLDHPGVFKAVFSRPTGPDPVLRTSPFLVFALALHRCAAELREAAFVPEWVGPGRRVAVFDAAELRTFLEEPAHRLFLAELLASYTHVTSGSVIVPTRRGRRRRRFSELDPVRMAALAELVPEAERPGVYRRLGDLALFLTGVFPDHTEARAFSPVDEERLRRSAGGGRRDVDPALPGEGPVALLEGLGRSWYREAATTALVPTEATSVVAAIADRFDLARRILNLVTERHLFPFRDRWLSSG